METSNALEAMRELSPAVVYPFVFTWVHTGARREEVRLLKWEHIDVRPESHPWPSEN